ncbi:hypothetical protein M405DRAFT_869267 [Rhizopogon salebrosus TDB-379]|nr:hypothetical protein M405DRAFT_869267 [Rhizopogon salebrosus TDB-379]
MAIALISFFITHFLISLPSSTLQIRIVLSIDPVAILLPSGNVLAVTHLVSCHPSYWAVLRSSGVSSAKWEDAKGRMRVSELF